MPRKRKIEKLRTIDRQALDKEIAYILDNPFAALSPRPGFPWSNATCFAYEDPAFPMAEARRVWRTVKEVVIARWQKDHPLRRPWGYWLFDVGMDDEPRNHDQADILEKRGVLSEYEQRLLEMRRADNKKGRIQNGQAADND